MSPTPPIFVHEYLLRSGVALNAASHRRVFPGALLRVGSGYGCVHPWPEFGDVPIDEQLRLLAEGVTTPVTEMALRCAKVDGEAREAGVSLFQGLDIPRSHYSWSFAQDTQPQFERVLSEGWLAIKAKGYANYGETTRFLENCARLSDGHDLRFRVDFNGCLDEEACRKFIEFMSVRLYRQMDWVEDPFPYNAAAWAAIQDKWGAKLALDKGWREGTTGFEAVVVKPARRDWRIVAEKHPDKTLILTSAMDHGLGQMFAAYEAAVARRDLGEKIGLCGLSTQHLFDNDSFFERIKVSGGWMTPDLNGGGLGFGDVLASLPWRPL